MNENETKTDETKDQGKEEIQMPPMSPLEEARLLDESIKKSNADLKLLLDRQEKLAAEARLEGKGFAGQSMPSISPESKIKMEARNFFKGTDIERALAQYG